MSTDNETATTATTTTEEVQAPLPELPRTVICEVSRCNGEAAVKDKDGKFPEGTITLPHILGQITRGDRRGELFPRLEIKQDWDSLMEVCKYLGTDVLFTILDAEASKKGQQLAKANAVENPGKGEMAFDIEGYVDDAATYSMRGESTPELQAKQKEANSKLVAFLQALAVSGKSFDLHTAEITKMSKAVQAFDDAINKRKRAPRTPKAAIAPATN